MQCSTICIDNIQKQVDTSRGTVIQNYWNSIQQDQHIYKIPGRAPRLLALLYMLMLMLKLMLSILYRRAPQPHIVRVRKFSSDTLYFANLVLYLELDHIRSWSSIEHCRSS